MTETAKRNRRNRKRGKAHERRTAKMLGGKRIGLLGSEDVSHPLFSIECKSVASFVGKRWIEQAERNCPEGKIPIVVAHIKKTRSTSGFVIMRITDFQDMVGTTVPFSGIQEYIKGGEIDAGKKA